MLSSDLLCWYDASRRSFPWRAVSGERPNPYHVWLSEVMLQQTTTTTVIPYFNRFITKWPNAESLARAELDEVLHAWQGLGYYSRARSLHKASQILARGFPISVEELLALPGVGPYTAGAIGAIAYDQQTAPVDGNIARIYARIAQINEVKPQLFSTVKTLLQDHVPEKRNGDFIQGLMDVGATICLPKKPKCEACPLKIHCLSFQSGSQEEYPLKVVKKERPHRYGLVFWIQDKEGRVMLRRRPENGLLGGMMEFPSTPWLENEWSLEDSVQHQPVPFTGLKSFETIEHTFTHFHLILGLVRGFIEDRSTEGEWALPSDHHLYALPTVMKKVAKAAIKE